MEYELLCAFINYELRSRLYFVMFVRYTFKNELTVAAFRINYPGANIFGHTGLLCRKSEE